MTQLVDVLCERVTRDGPGGEGTVTRTYNELAAALNAAAGEMLAPYHHADVRPSEVDWLDELQYEAWGAAMRAALSAMAQTVMAGLAGAPESLRSTSERLLVDLALERSEELPERQRDRPAA